MTFKLVSVSRLDPIKNIEDVLLVVKKLVDEGYSISYSIVGDGKHRDVLERIVEQLHIKVSFEGYQNNPYPFLLNGDLFVLNSFSEGFSNSLIEAMFSGTPSLSTKVGAADEIIEDGINGWLINPADKEELYTKIKHIIALSEKKRREIGCRGKEVAQNYSLEKHIQQLMVLYGKN